MTRFRICWSASSNASFHGETDWEPFGPSGDNPTREEVEDALYAGDHTSEGLGIALEASGFEWWVEVREANEDA